MCNKHEKFVKGFFTIFGHGNVLGLGQALEQDAGDMTIHQGKSEQGMAHAAIGFAKQKNRKQIYVCSSSVGPGAANMVTAAATATANRIPILLLPGDTFSVRQPDPVLQQIEQFHDLSITTNDAFKAVSKYWDRINRPEQLMTAMVNAMRVLTDPANTGAVTISLPQDVQGEAFLYPDYFFKERVHRIERRPATKEAIFEAVSLIKRKRKPLLICGGGVRYSEAADAFDQFATKHCIPFGETQAGKSALIGDHNLNLGGIGTTGNLAANLIAKEADLVISVGSRLSDFTTASKWLFQNSEVEFLNINVANFDAHKMDAIKVVADAKEALNAISCELGTYRSAYTDEINQAKDKWHIELKRLFDIEYCENGFIPEVAGQRDHILAEFKKVTNSCLTQTKVLGILDKILDDNAIIVGASGSLPGDLQRIWQAKAKNTYHMEYGYSCMGYEVNAALGAKIAAPSQEVYALVGDGSYLMLHSELLTSIQEKQKINIILLDNMSFRCINTLQMENGMDSFATENRYRTEKGLAGDFVPVDFAKNAQGYGCITYTPKTEMALIEAIQDAKKQSVSTLIDIKVLPKTMTKGYASWWRVGNAEVAEDQKIVSANKALKKELKNVRAY